MGVKGFRGASWSDIGLPIFDLIDCACDCACRIDRSIMVFLLALIDFFFLVCGDNM